jgi:hypothetical protein
MNENDDNTDTGKSEYFKTNLSQCHFVPHKSNMDRPGTDTRLL